MSLFFAIACSDEAAYGLKVVIGTNRQEPTEAAKSVVNSRAAQESTDMHYILGSPQG